MSAIASATVTSYSVTVNLIFDEIEKKKLKDAWDDLPIDLLDSYSAVLYPCERSHTIRVNYDFIDNDVFFDDWRKAIEDWFNIYLSM